MPQRDRYCISLISASQVRRTRERHPSNGFIGSAQSIEHAHSFSNARFAG
jgi:hypothetical protein